jgi:hypothetical protein
MHPLLLLLHLAAAVMLLLWAVRMVRTGMERALGAALRDGLRKAGSGVTGAAGAGMVLAILLQSATAVGLLSAGFVASGLLGGTTALAAMLGADLGSALVVKLRAAASQYPTSTSAGRTMAPSPELLPFSKATAIASSSALARLGRRMAAAKAVASATT